ncbi:MAG: TlyA family RNA methyltransferase [Pseudomonadota bacterium]
MKRVRIDRLLMELEMVPSRQKAVALIMAGCVYVGETKAAKPGQLVDPEAKISIRGEDHPYVGRGGVKLARALDEFKVEVEGKTCMDVGASTGGFTDCLLQRGAARVYAIDVGYGQLAWKLASDERVVVIERTNIRKMPPDNIPSKIDIAVIDVSFISLSIVLPVVDTFLSAGSLVVALIKPQFEVGRELVGKGGIVRDPKSHELATERIRSAGLAIGWSYEGVVDSPILGAKGNREFLICFLKKNKSDEADLEKLIK